jgi:hypothetical protein
MAGIGGDDRVRASVAGHVVEIMDRGPPVSDVDLPDSVGADPVRHDRPATEVGDEPGNCRVLRFVGHHDGDVIGLHHSDRQQ